MNKNTLKIKKTKLWWLFIVIAVMMLILGVFFLPVWSDVDIFFNDWGKKAVCLGIGVLIVLYLVLFLVKKLKGSGASAVRVLTFIEFGLLAVTAVGCLLITFGISLGLPTETNGCMVLGMAFYFRGVVEIFRAYYHKKDSKDTYPLWWLAVAVAFVTLGCWMFFKPFFQNTLLQWILSISILCIAIITFVYAFLAKPESKKKETPKQIEDKK